MPTLPPTALRTASATACGCFLVVVVVVLDTADRLTVLFTLLVGVVAAEVGVAAVANMADEATAAAGMMVNGVLGAVKNCVGTDTGTGPAIGPEIAPGIWAATGLVGVAGAVLTPTALFT